MNNSENEMESELLVFTNDAIYEDCWLFAVEHKNAMGYCQVLGTSGLVSFLLTIPTVMFGLLGGIALVAAVGRSTVWRAKLRLYAVTQFIIDLLFSTVVGIMHLLLCYGLPWLSYAGVYLHKDGDLDCRIVHFLYSLSFSAMSTLLLASTLDFVLSVRFNGQASPTSTRTAVFGSTLLAVVFALPDLAVCNLWNLDGRIYCSTSATLPSIVILLAEIHRFFFVHGFSQCISTLVLLCILSKITKSLDNTVSLLYGASQAKDNVCNAAYEASEVARHLKEKANFILVRSALMGTTLFLRALLCLWLDIRLYFLRQERRSDARTILYTYIGVKHILDYMVILASAFHYWLYYFNFECLRNDPSRSETSDQDGLVMPVHPNPRASLVRLRQLITFVCKFDYDLCRQLQSLQQALVKTTERRLDREQAVRSHLLLRKPEK
ncbi:hypothetical protein CRM22_004747 [Opisthorchis felineus]|uniref:G-protein coupled receptors family 1 profile domain-containing protein n=1 Tax=Opisthorchis felineus TaxID=147828 RepID=A0A4S2LUL3_OPIFE|nr:hypothetical protein CRM22_004747 [Opisthorchis felineus]